MPSVTRYLVVTHKERKRFGDTVRFRLRGNGMLFEILAHVRDLDQAKMDEINEQFANSLRIVKHHGGYFEAGTTDKEAQKFLNDLSQTSTGIGIKVRNDPLPEFERFVVE